MTRDMQHMTCGGGGKTSIGATIRIGREIRCLPYAGFFLIKNSLIPKIYLFQLVVVRFWSLKKAN